MTNPTVVLVVGAGAIGQRHIRNLRSLGITAVLAVDSSEDRLAEAEQCGARACPNLEIALERRPVAVLVCTPADSHIPLARAAIHSGAHVFIEKPIAARLEGVDELLRLAESKQLLVGVGYNLRFHAGVRQLKQLIDECRLGRVLAVRAEFGQYLPDWRPTQDYRSGYHARADIGGIILDASHELDYVCWLIGDVERVYCAAGHLSALETQAEDVAAITMRASGGALVEVHLDCVQRGYSRNCKVIGEAGTAVWEFTGGVRLLGDDGQDWRNVGPASVDLNEMYMAELSHFLRCVRGEETLLVDGGVGRRALHLALAARESAALGREVTV